MAAPRYKAVLGDCVQLMREAAARGSTVHAVVCDPPYHLSTTKRFGKEGSAPPSSDGATGVYKRAARGFMGKEWDGGDVAFDPETWRAAHDLLPPGGHLVAFSSSRTYHRMATAIEAAGFEVRDQLMWLYGTGFPKSHDVSKGIDRAAGAEREIVGTRVYAGPSGNDANFGVGDLTKSSTKRLITAPVTDAARQWEGWGTALKPAHEPIVLARKPLVGTVAANVQEHGTGALNIDATRVHGEDAKGGAYTVTRLKTGAELAKTGGNWRPDNGVKYEGEMKPGRWPANVVHDGSDEVEEEFAKYGTTKSKRSVLTSKPGDIYGGGAGLPSHTGEYGFNDSGTASRFFYCAKASKAERQGSNHPTVKPVALMRWLVRMVCPPGGTVLDPFAGTGTTGEAALLEGMRPVLLEADDAYYADLVRRMDAVNPGAEKPIRKRRRT